MTTTFFILVWFCSLPLIEYITYTSALIINFSYEQSGSVVKQTVEVSARIMTACPCTLAYSRLKGEKTIRKQMQSPNFVLPEEFPPTFTHSQPGELTVAVTSTDDLPNLPDLMRCLDRVARELENQRLDFELRAKHLYHDREEVTVHVRVFG